MARSHGATVHARKELSWFPAALHIHHLLLAVSRAAGRQGMGGASRTTTATTCVLALHISVLCRVGLQGRGVTRAVSHRRRRRCRRRVGWPGRRRGVMASALQLLWQQPDGSFEGLGLPPPVRPRSAPAPRRRRHRSIFFFLARIRSFRCCCCF